MPVTLRALAPSDNDRVFAFARWSGTEQLIVISNFDAKPETRRYPDVPADIIAALGLDAMDARHCSIEQL